MVVVGDCKCVRKVGKEVDVDCNRELIEKHLPNDLDWKAIHLFIMNIQMKSICENVTMK